MSVALRGKFITSSRDEEVFTPPVSVVHPKNTWQFPLEVVVANAAEAKGNRVAKIDERATRRYRIMR